MCRGFLLLVDVHFGADDDRHPRHHGRKPAIQARGQQECVDDVRSAAIVRSRSISINCQGFRQPGVTPRTWNSTPVFRISSPIGPAVFKHRHHGLETLRQVLDQVQHHFLGAADHERVGHVDRRGGARHEHLVRALKGHGLFDAVGQRRPGRPADLAADPRHVRDEVAGLDLFRQPRPRHVFDSSAAG